MYDVYILKLHNKKLYIGYTNDLKKRIVEHQTGMSVHTKKFLPCKLIYYEAFASRKDAIKREKNIKKFKGSYRQLKLRIASSIFDTKEGMTLLYE